MPQISVIVPVYKVEEYLPFCVDSILAQTFTDYELILVDDGSPDRCGEICDEYAAQDSRVRVIHRENGGLSAARNSGMDIAEGEYITFIDSDDAVTNIFLESFAEIAENNSADIVSCGLLEFEDSDILSLNEAKDNITFRLHDGRTAAIGLYSGNPNTMINACGKLFKQELIGGDRFPEGRLHEDQAFVPPVCYRAGCVALVNQEMYLYRVRSESITKSKFSLKRYDDLWAIDNCIRLFEEKGETEIAAEAKKKRRRLLCVYSIYAKRDGVEVPEEYRVGTWKALKYLYGHTSHEKYEYYLAQVNPKYVRWFEYIIKIKSILRIRG